MSKRLLADFREDRLRFLFLAKVRQQQEHPGKTFLTRIEQLIDEGCLDTDGPIQKMCNEHLGERWFLMDHAESLQRELAEEVGRVNGKLGDVDWTPLRYINKTMSRSALAGLYRIARIGLVTPLRDGMNLVAKEYVAAQAPDNPGVLVLSQFAEKAP